MSIEIFNQSGIELPELLPSFVKYVEQMEQKEKVEFGFVEVVYVDEDRIVEVNKEYLSRDYITDIISFHYHEDGEPVEGTLFCCAQRIKEQALEFSQDFESELKRVFIHGCLHLLGYDDQTPSEKAQMTDREDFYLNTK